MYLPAVVLGMTISVTPADPATVERFCDDQWGELLPLKRSCVESQQKAANELEQALKESIHLSAKEIQDHIMSRLFAFTGGDDINDDYTTMIVKFK